MGIRFFFLCFVCAFFANSWEGLVFFSIEVFCFIYREGARERDRESKHHKNSTFSFVVEFSNFQFQQQNPKFKNLRENTFFFKPFTQSHILKEYKTCL